jgi:GWxTD domain-containing protein
VLVQLNDERWIWTDTLTSETPRWLSNKFDLNNIISEGSKETGSWLGFEITDQNRNSSIKNAAEIREVLIWNLNENWPLSNSNAATGTPLKIISAGTSTWNVFHVVPPKSLPAPPFSRYRNPLDTLTAAPHSIIEEDWITLEGVQKFTSTSNDMEFVIYGRHEDFPDAKDVLFLIESTRYIATRSEYSAMQMASHPKESLDDFWLSCGKSPEKSKELIKTYYARVEEANRYFSGLLEGWRTDRGMIHIVHGVPNRVRRDYWNEYWTYGEEGTSNTLTFRFRRRQHELDNNLFKLERNIVFKSTWDRMVTSWRNGRVQRD